MLKNILDVKKMDKYVVFHESSHFYMDDKEIYHGYIVTKKCLEIGHPIVHTTQMALMDFDLNDLGYDIIIAFNKNIHKCKNPFVLLKVGCQINKKDIRKPHNLLKMYMSGFMHSSIDKFDDNLQAESLQELILKQENYNV